ncbi:MAG TPA: membrane-bound lytic murein transglycosylase MltF [Gammaproteobacteria bacterium]|nr:membrane-bound lytic murein transglycosylase MltF [Gammaproteobacteria bacterium]
MSSSHTRIFAQIASAWVSFALFGEAPETSRDGAGNGPRGLLTRRFLPAARPGREPARPQRAWLGGCFSYNRACTETREGLPLARIIGTLALGFALGSCSIPPSLLEQVVRSGALKVVTRSSPTTYYDGAGEPRGIEYELVKGYAERLGVELELYVADEFRQIFPEIQQGRAHIAAAGISITEPRKAIVDFSPPYERVQQQIIYRRGSRRPYALGDLYGGRLEVLAGSAYVGALNEAKKQHPQLEWVENAELGIEELVRRVAAGEIDYTIVDSNVFELLQHSHPEARVGFSLSPRIPLAWALPKTADTSLRESVSAYIAELQASGQLAALIDSYRIDEPENFDYVGSRAFVRHFDDRLPAYRNHFREASTRSGFDWRLLAAMAYQESHWNPDAVSPTGVRGIMMLTRHTAGLVGVEDRTDPRQSIVGGADYLARVLKKIPERIPEPDRTMLAIAAYNIGFGHVEDARIITEIQGGNPDSWNDVRERLPLLSEPEWFSRVSRGPARGAVAALYAENVRRYFEILQWLTSDDALFTEQETEPADDVAVATQAG